MLNPDGWEVARALGSKVLSGMHGEGDLYGEFIMWFLSLVHHERIHLLAYCNMAFCLAVIFFYVNVWVFLGELRIMEDHALRERTVNYILFKVIFLGAVVEPELIELICWCGCFTVLGMIKMLGSLGRDRFEFIVVSHNATVVDHVRLTALLCLVFSTSALWGVRVWNTFYDGAGPSVVLLLLFECTTCILCMLQTLSRYIVYAINLHVYQGEWSWHGPLWYLIGFVGDTTCLMLSAGHYFHVWTINGISLNLVDAILFLNIRVTIANMVKNTTGWLNYCNMMRQLDSAWPDATSAELEAIDENCGICLRHLHEAKRLPCNHYFHRACLQRLMEGGGQPACPMCRAPLFPENGAGVMNNGNGGGLRGNTNFLVHMPRINLQLGINLSGNGRRTRPPVPRDPHAHEAAIRALFPNNTALLTSETGPNLAQGQRLVGHEICKRFGLRYYGGRVVRVWEAVPGTNGRHVDQRTIMYRIDYEDGDREDMIWNELSRLLVGITVSSTGASLLRGAGGAGSSDRAGHVANGSLTGADGGSGDDGVLAVGAGSAYTAHVICAWLYDWTGTRPALYRFAATTPISEVAKTYAAERGLDGANVTLHVYDLQKKEPIQLSMAITLEDTVRMHSSTNPRVGPIGADTTGADTTCADECRLFVMIKCFPECNDGGVARFITTRDFVRLQRRRRRLARMAANP